MAKFKPSRREFLNYSASALLLASPFAFPWRAIGSPSERGFMDLFDGETLSGWHTNYRKIKHGTGGRWQVEGGVLTGEQDPPGSGNGGILMTDRLYGDFELRLDLAPDWGIDSGIFLRTNDMGECFQIFVDYRNRGLVGHVSTERADKDRRMFIRPFYIEGIHDDQGNLVDFDTKPDERGELAWKPEYLQYHCTPGEWKRAWKINAWNSMTIRCVGKYPKITTWINGTKIMHFDGATSPHPMNDREELFGALGREGAIGLQVHLGKGWRKGAKCRWKNIRIKEL